MFVVFEGIDGSGKTTISNQVAERLSGKGLRVKHLRAEGKFASSVTEAIRELGRDAKNLELVPQAELLLYVAREVQLIEEALRPALATHDLVIADRFLYTAEVLGRFGRMLPVEWTRSILDPASLGIAPDLVVLVDVDPTLARARRKAFKLAARDRRPPSRKGLAGVGLQHRLRHGYIELATQDPERWVVVENEDELELSVARVTALIEDARARGAKSAIESFRSEVRTRPVPVTPTSPERALESFLRWIDERARREPRVAAYFLSGLCGSEVDERRRALAEEVPEAILAGLTGLEDAVSWSLREELAARYPGAVARTLSGISGTNERAHSLRKQLEPRAPVEVASSLDRLDDEPSWQIRERLWLNYPDAVAASLIQLEGERAWSLRARWLESIEAALGADYELSRIACRSITGLDDERAWAVRTVARGAAPVAALASVAGLVTTRSLQWREELLVRAPKVVMTTLRRVAHPRAWAMRRAVVETCKEAIDSVDSMDDAEAWELREAHWDRWPSTVVKTLGPLADGPRGRALVERQLASHGTNISLLKHVSAIVLGLHRLKGQRPD